MSYVTIYQVMANGDVLEVGEGSNNHAFAPLVWKYLGEKYGYGKDVMSERGREGLRRMWNEWPSPKMERWEHILLGATFDFVWIPRELLAELIAACDRFYGSFIINPRYETDWQGVMRCSTYDTRTLMGDQPSTPEEPTYGRKGIIPCLKEILDDPTSRGAAFNCCSAVSPFWTVYDVPPGGEGHSKDEDCAGHIVDGECTVCGVWHDEDACSECKATGFHKEDCSEYTWGHRPWNVDKDITQPRGEYRDKRAYNLLEEMGKACWADRKEEDRGQ